MTKLLERLPIIVFALVTMFMGDGVFSGTFIISLSVFLAGFLIYQLLYLVETSNYTGLLGSMIESILLLAFSIICTVLLVQNTGEIRWIFIQLINIISGYATLNFREVYAEDEIIETKKEVPEDENDSDSD